MSRSEILFDPRALRRVAVHVEWEPELRYYRDGKTNQEEYVQAMVTLWERWMREFELPDFLALVYAGGRGDWRDGLQQVMDTLEEKVSQWRGFWRGLWQGANPPKATFVPYSPIPYVPATWFTGTPSPPAEVSVEQEFLNMFTAFFDRLRVLAEPLEKVEPAAEPEEEPSGED